MSGTTTSRDPAPHLDLDALADVLAGEAGADDSAHLRGCSSCTSRLAELEAAEARVVSVLSTLPPPTVPADLAERLTSALAAQAPLEPGRASVTALPAASVSRRRTWMPAAAAAVLLVSGAGIGWSLVGGGNGGSSDDSATAGAGFQVTASGTDWADPAAISAALPGVLSGDESFARQRGEAGGDDGDAGAGAAADTALTEAEAPTAAMSSVDPLERLRTPDGLAECLAGLQGGPEEAPVEPLALDYATYAGAPALAVVLPDPDPAKLSVFVVGPECAPADAALLHFVRVDAP